MAMACWYLPMAGGEPSNARTEPAPAEPPKCITTSVMCSLYNNATYKHWLKKRTVDGDHVWVSSEGGNVLDNLREISTEIM